jgi:hypothetical protein
MKNLALGALTLAIGLYGSAANADLLASSSSHVFVDVTANIAIAPPLGDVDLGDQMNDFTGAAVFTVDANSQDVYLTCGASNLYKGNDPLGTEVKSLAVNLSAGCRVNPANGNRMAGLDNTLAFQSGEEEIIDGFPVAKSEQGHYESSQNGHFSQDVTIIVDWDIPLEQPQGEYSGIVALWGAIL